MKAFRTLASPVPVSAPRSRLGGRRRLILTAVALAVPAIWLGWPWLLAAGIGPVLLSLAPCLIMCGLGFCMLRSCSKQEQPGSAAADAAMKAAGASEFSRSCSTCSSPAGNAPTRRR